MDPLVSEHAPAVHVGSKPRALCFYRLAWLLFLAQSVLVCANSWLLIFGKNSEPALRALLLVLALVTTCASLARALPFQNVALAVVLIGAISVATLVLANAWRFLWLVPLYWVVVVLNSRGIARLILDRFRDLPGSGLWFLGIATGLAVVNFELWAPGLGLAGFRYGHGFLGHGMILSALSFLTAITIVPALINKRPGQAPPTSFQPLWVAAVLTAVALFS